MENINKFQLDNSKPEIKKNLNRKNEIFKSTNFRKISIDSIPKSHYKTNSISNKDITNNEKKFLFNSTPINLHSSFNNNASFSTSNNTYINNDIENTYNNNNVYNTNSINKKNFFEKKPAAQNNNTINNTNFGTLDPNAELNKLLELKKNINLNNILENSINNLIMNFIARSTEITNQINKNNLQNETNFGNNLSSQFDLFSMLNSNGNSDKLSLPPNFESVFINSLIEAYKQQAQQAYINSANSNSEINLLNQSSFNKNSLNNNFYNNKESNNKKKIIFRKHEEKAAKLNKAKDCNFFSENSSSNKKPKFISYIDENKHNNEVHFNKQIKINSEIEPKNVYNSNPNNHNLSLIEDSNRENYSHETYDTKYHENHNVIQKSGRVVKKNKFYDNKDFVTSNFKKALRRKRKSSVLCMQKNNDKSYENSQAMRKNTNENGIVTQYKNEGKYNSDNFFKNQNQAFNQENTINANFSILDEEMKFPRQRFENESNLNIKNDYDNICNLNNKTNIFDENYLINTYYNIGNFGAKYIFNANDNSDITADFFNQEFNRNNIQSSHQQFQQIYDRKNSNIDNNINNMINSYIGKDNDNNLFKSNSNNNFNRKSDTDNNYDLLNNKNNSNDYSIFLKLDINEKENVNNYSFKKNNFDNNYLSDFTNKENCSNRNNSDLTNISHNTYHNNDEKSCFNKQNEKHSTSNYITNNIINETEIIEFPIHNSICNDKYFNNNSFNSKILNSSNNYTSLNFDEEKGIMKNFSNIGNNSFRNSDFTQNKSAFEKDANIIHSDNIQFLTLTANTDNNNSFNYNYNYKPNNTFVDINNGFSNNYYCNSIKNSYSNNFISNEINSENKFFLNDVYNEKYEIDISREDENLKDSNVDINNFNKIASYYKNNSSKDIYCSMSNSNEQENSNFKEENKDAKSALYANNIQTGLFNKQVFEFDFDNFNKNKKSNSQTIQSNRITVNALDNTNYKINQNKCETINIDLNHNINALSEKTENMNYPIIDKKGDIIPVPVFKKNSNKVKVFKLGLNKNKEIAESFDRIKNLLAPININLSNNPTNQISDLNKGKDNSNINRNNSLINPSIKTNLNLESIFSQNINYPQLCSKRLFLDIHNIDQNNNKDSISEKLLNINDKKNKQDTQYIQKFFDKKCIEICGDLLICPELLPINCQKYLNRECDCLEKCKEKDKIYREFIQSNKAIIDLEF